MSSSKIFADAAFAFYPVKVGVSCPVKAKAAIVSPRLSYSRKSQKVGHTKIVLFDYQSEAPKAQPRLEVTKVLPQVQLTILRGHTTKKNYRFAKSRINLGRLAEVLDDHHVVRRNDLIFQEGVDDIDQTVSREHAHVKLDETTGELRLYDDGSAYGTRIFRDGQTIEVQASNRRGAKLRPGDEIFLGQACIRFDVQKQPK